MSVSKQVLCLLVACLGLAGAANADQLVSRQAADGQEANDVFYKINPRLGRAWIEINLYDRSCSGGDEGCYSNTTVRAKVPGMSYDAATESVVYSENGAAPVVCAKVRHHHFVTRWITVDATGRCGIRSAVSSEVRDDGYETTQVKHLDVYFGVKTN